MSSTAAVRSSPCLASMSICDLERIRLTGTDMPRRLRNESTGTRERGTKLSGYTHKNLSDVKDAAPGFGFGEMGEVRFAKDYLEAERTGIRHLKLDPGVRMPLR